MKNLGKQPVIITTLVTKRGYCNRRSQLTMRVVYEKADGRFFINWLDGKAEVILNKDGAYEFTHKIFGITRTEAIEILRSVGSRVVI